MIPFECIYPDQAAIESQLIGGVNAMVEQWEKAHDSCDFNI